MDREVKASATPGVAGNSDGTAIHPLAMLGLALLSWLGAYYHTSTELGLGPLRPENSGPALVGLGLFMGWWRSSGSQRLWTWLLMAWTVGAHLLVGAVLSVLPLALLPFQPEQSLAHYRSHLIYGLAQLPLMIVLVISLAKRGKPAAGIVDAS